MFRQLKLTCRGMFHCTFSNNWPKLATLADNGARTKEHKAQRVNGAKKHQLPRAARPVSLPEGNPHVYTDYFSTISPVMALYQL